MFVTVKNADDAHDATVAVLTLLEGKAPAVETSATTLRPGESASFHVHELRSLAVSEGARIPEARCERCKALKPVSEFYADKGMASGHKRQCKECTIAARNER